MPRRGRARVTTHHQHKHRSPSKPYVSGLVALQRVVVHEHAVVAEVESPEHAWLHTLNWPLVCVREGMGVDAADLHTKIANAREHVEGYL